ncbi:D-alanyl-D-alanine carboxypeptidase/D-alanyl-D-alanine-endopeptidase [Sporosarcina sp. ACRSM]|uniref:D-alanyl-D-alanine carboxypeptidase/D-alanyl-D-alanine endopeptidase n=1 Tax=Sporosarcina sp. ACRSM TaxID=2918216 RepID=UPI001EF6FF56|nr:D-alanyl-D-alanine carboxypeptidase/D-alanyl-D-alanine-endopeptidase [Sporosarcina sp. ACRSM]MCG7335185.1 D-alanyl-D-alanine carboxypeptidase/D-alanyl-D-alanine-endopeptidase [Sporosarcina sp. ACRSM]
MKQRRAWQIGILIGMIVFVGGMMIAFNQEGEEASVKEMITVSAELEQSLPEPLSDTQEFPEVDKLLKDPRLQGATTAISVRHAVSGEVIYAHQGNTRVHPASVMKLFTGAAVLETLGEDHRFKTELYMDGKIQNGVLDGDLYLKGLGDPTLMMKDLKAFAAELKAKGVRTINGQIFGDDSWYDQVRLSQDLNWSDEPFYTGAQVSALTLSPNEDYDAGTVIVEVQPGKKSGQAGKIRMVPANSYLTIVNNTKTVAKKGKKNIQVERQHGTNTVIVSGTIPIGASKARSWSSVWEPTDYAVNVFKHVLEDQGIAVSPASKVGSSTVPKGAVLVADKSSIPLKELLIPFIKLSNNGHAEVLVKEMGRLPGGAGSWEKGLAVMDNQLASMGLDTKNMQLRDGSGMSHKNLVTANEVTHLLYVARSKPWYPTFLQALPVAGHDERLIGGTLRNRMKGTAAAGNVRAKTGALNGVTALSGYIETKEGETLIFSIMINNYLSESIHEVVDGIVVALVDVRLE